MVLETQFVVVANELDRIGLPWQPEVGDEISTRHDLGSVSILFDPAGLTVKQLRDAYIWLPTVEQIVMQLEIRQAILQHAGLEIDERVYQYKAVVKSRYGEIASAAPSLREALGISLRDLLQLSINNIH